MLSLAEGQRLVREALTGDVPAALAPLLCGGAEPLARLAIHRRHFQASLTGALMQKFPATAWYAGSTFVAEAARLFVHRSPPRAPCIAEYGETFPDFLATMPGAERGPLLRWLARLDWHLGQVAIAIEETPLGLDAFMGFSPEALCDLALATQPGLRHLEAPYPADALMRIYLHETPPVSLALEPELVRLEIRGARGAFHFRRLDPPLFAFRSALAAGCTLGKASEAALALDEGFDLTAAFAAFIAEGLASGIRSLDALGGDR